MLVFRRTLHHVLMVSCLTRRVHILKEMFCWFCALPFHRQHLLLSHWCPYLHLDLSYWCTVVHLQCSVLLWSYDSRRFYWCCFGNLLTILCTFLQSIICCWWRYCVSMELVQWSKVLTIWPEPTWPGCPYLATDPTWLVRWTFKNTNMDVECVVITIWQTDLWTDPTPLKFLPPVTQLQLWCDLSRMLFNTSLMSESR